MTLEEREQRFRDGLRCLEHAYGLRFAGVVIVETKSGDVLAHSLIEVPADTSVRGGLIVTPVPNWTPTPTEPAREGEG